MWLSIHAVFTEEGGWGWEEGKRDWGLRGREVVFLSLLAQREGKTIGVQMDASPLFLDDLPLLSSVPSLHPSLLQSQDV